MKNYTELFKEYNTTKDICQFCCKYKDIATKFLLIRSLDKANVKELLLTKKIETDNNKIEILGKMLFDTDVTTQELIDYIVSKKDEILRQRSQELQGMDVLLEKFPIEKCGVRNDKIDDLVKSFVRDKGIKIVEDIEKKLDKDLIPKIRKYVLWSYYNQTSNDIIELSFLKHPVIIPTLRKIPNIDFFLNIGGDIIPFDLKITHISDDYFELKSKGLTTSNCDGDDFVLSDAKSQSESQVIKNHYKKLKKHYKSLPNFGKLSKEQIVDIIQDYDTDFVEKMKECHTEYVPHTPEELRAVEWWNYKYQGERLFCNNNRFYVFLAYDNLFKDGRELKGKISKIQNKIIEVLDEIYNGSIDRIHKITYYYDNTTELQGNYAALSISTIYTE